MESITWKQDVQELARVLVGKNRGPYERLRRDLIIRLGYDGFRDLQREAMYVAFYPV